MAMARAMAYLYCPAPVMKRDYLVYCPPSVMKRPLRDHLVYCPPSVMKQPLRDHLVYCPPSVMKQPLRDHLLVYCSPPIMKRPFIARGHLVYCSPPVMKQPLARDHLLVYCSPPFMKQYQPPLALEQDDHQPVYCSPPMEQCQQHHSTPVTGVIFPRTPRYSEGLGVSVPYDMSISVIDTLFPILHPLGIYTFPEPLDRTP